MRPDWTLRAAIALCARGAAAAIAQAPGASTGGLLPSVPGGIALPGGAAQPAPGQAPLPAGAGARFVENCQQALERGSVPPGCQGPLYGSEIARLKDEALRSNDPTLLTLLGDAYQSNRSAISDVSQAYRWYLLAAVRGDPRAMQRLSELYQGGRGAPQDSVKALGYARLAQRLALPGSKTAAEAARASAALAGTLAAEEVTLAERFSKDLESTLRRQGVPLTETPEAPAGGAAAGLPVQGSVTALERSPAPASGPGIPGMTGILQAAPVKPGTAN